MRRPAAILIEIEQFEKGAASGALLYIAVRLR